MLMVVLVRVKIRLLGLQDPRFIAVMNLGEGEAFHPRGLGRGRFGRRDRRLVAKEPPSPCCQEPYTSQHPEPPEAAPASRPSMHIIFHAKFIDFL